MRKLATIRKIDRIENIKGRDLIGLAHIDGWTVIVNKDQFKEKELCVYCEIDSVLPDIKEFQFLKKKIPNLRIRTMKMAGVISQGICFPISILPSGDYKENQDVTSILNITQYRGNMDIENYEDNSTNWYKKLPILSLLFKKEYKGFPKFISKTDEPRVQNMPQILNYYKDNKDIKWHIHEKLDGQSGTFVCIRNKGIFKDKFEYIVCSRNLRLLNKDNSSYWKVSDKYNIRDKLIKYLKDNPKEKFICVQGECIGESVQGNKYKIKGYDFYVFNVISSYKKFEEELSDAFCSIYGFNRVPLVKDNINMRDITLEKLIKAADGKSLISNTIREGIVIRDNKGNSFKVISNNFLLKNKE